jgi:flavorubredoxin
MEQIKIFDDLYLFRTMNQDINLTFNQYLLLGAEPILIHTGNVHHAADLVPKIKAILGKDDLSYIFISHFEADECGGLGLLLSQFPNTKPVCSPVTARQFRGFGFKYDFVVKAPGECLQTPDYKLDFISYPAEMHLWEGLLAFESHRKILFSSDLFIRMGAVPPTPVEADWQQEIGNITPQQIPSPEARNTLQQVLAALPVKYVAAGHGPVLSVLLSDQIPNSQAVDRTHLK